MKRGLALASAVLALFALAIWMERRSHNPQEAFESFSESKLMVNTDFELDEIRSVRGGFGDRVGRIEASYEGPDKVDALEVHVFENQDAADDAWDQHVVDAEGSTTPPSTRQPRYAGQICSVDGATIRCSVQMHEAIVVGIAAGGDRDAVKANAQGLLMAGVKHWLDARGLDLPEEREM